MFLKSIKIKLEQLGNSLGSLEGRIAILENRPQVDIQAFKNEVEARLLSFHKEITDRYFSTLEKILRVHTESSIITSLAHNIDQRTLDNLKSSLMQPFLEAKWKADKEEKGEKIEGAGEQIINEFSRLRNQMLEMERKGEDIGKIKIQVEVYESILGRLTK